MSYFVPGGGVAACCHPGAAQNDLFAVNERGQLCVLTRDSQGTWSPPLPLTDLGFAPAGAFVFTSPDYGAPLPGCIVFLVDATGALQSFSQAAPGLSWRKESLSPSNSFVSGAQTFVALPTTKWESGTVNQITVMLIDANGVLHCYQRDAQSPWTLAGTKELGAAAANANVAGLARFDNSQVVQWLLLAYVDANGVMTLLSGVDGVNWEESVVPTDASPLSAGARLAASPRYGTAPKINQLDNANFFAVNVRGNLASYCLDDNANWTIKELTSSHIVKKQLLIFAEPGTALAAGRHYTQHDLGPYQTDVFVVGRDGNLHVFSSVDGGPWSPGTPIAEVKAAPVSSLVTAPLAPTWDPRTTMVYVCGTGGYVNVCQTDAADAWVQEVLPDWFSSEFGMLQGNRQVVLATPEGPLRDLRVSILVTEDLVPKLQIDALGNPVGGLAIQFNCDGRAGYPQPWEQFCIGLQPYTFAATRGQSSVSVEAQIWKDRGESILTQLSRALPAFPMTMDTPRIPAGYRFEISLASVNWTMIRATFEMFGPNGVQLGRWEVQLTDMNPKVLRSELADLVSCQVNIVGQDALQLTQLRSGAGTITFSSSTQLIPSQSSTVQATQTGEDSNCIYSTVPIAGGKSVLQSFQVRP
jgi:hypothetical protein